MEAVKCSYPNRPTDIDNLAPKTEHLISAFISNSDFHKMQRRCSCDSRAEGVGLDNYREVGARPVVV